METGKCDLEMLQQTPWLLPDIHYIQTSQKACRITTSNYNVSYFKCKYSVKPPDVSLPLHTSFKQTLISQNPKTNLTFLKLLSCLQKNIREHRSIIFKRTHKKQNQERGYYWKGPMRMPNSVITRSTLKTSTPRFANMSAPCMYGKNVRLTAKPVQFLTTIGTFSMILANLRTSSITCLDVCTISKSGITWAGLQK